MEFDELLEFLKSAENQRFLQMVRDNYPQTINEIAKLISSYPQKPVKSILSQIQIQNKLNGKIVDAHRYLFTEKNAQQASSTILSRYHRKRLETFKSIADLCCGVGMDLMHLATGKKEVWAVDANAAILRYAAFNCKQNGLDNIHYLNIKAEDFSEQVEAVFIDPDRREGFKRNIDPEDYTPSLSQIITMNKHYPNMICKLSPAVDYRTLEINVKHSWEFVSEGGILKEALLCLGNCSDMAYSKAVLADKGDYLSSDSLVNSDISSFKQYLFEPDPAIIRAGLVQQLAYKLHLNRIDEKLALLTGDLAKKTDWGKFYEIKDIFKYNFKKLKGYLREHEIGKLVIKTRGFPESVESFRKKLSLKGKKKALMFIVRYRDYHVIIFADNFKCIE